MRKHQIRILLSLAFVLFYMVLGTFVFHALEGWSYVDSFYFSGMTLTTVGYGDFVPTHTISKIFTVFFVLSGVGIVLYSITGIAQEYLSYRESKFLSRKGRILRAIKREEKF